MSVMSDAVYDARDAALCNVSSGAYYGYVPHCTQESRSRGGYISNWERVDGVAGHQRIVDNRRHHATAMETDDDGYGAASSRLSNYSIIPETTPWHNCRLEAIDYQQRYRRLQQQQEQRAYSETPRRNRKRCCDEHRGHESIVEPKKFRKGDGNEHVYHGTRSTNDYGLEQMHYGSPSLYLDTTGDIQYAKQHSITIESCCWAAGKSSLISNPDYKHLLLSSGDSKLNQDNTEYERMLFETHGCSIYHHQRMQLLNNDHIETEL